MSSPAHVDRPGELHWFTGHGPARILGSCPHEGCPHTATRVVAWGPDLEHYELVVCDVDEGCAGRCRGWIAQEEGSNGRGRLHHLAEFDPASERRTPRDDPTRTVPV
jgi:hypothetical protein